jgi:hypothetical protein
LPSIRHAAGDCWEHLDAGASTGHLVDTLDAAHPNLRHQLVDGLETNGVNVGPVPLDDLWPATVAYAVASTSQAAEEGRSPSLLLDRDVVGTTSEI